MLEKNIFSQIHFEKGNVYGFVLSQLFVSLFSLLHNFVYCLNFAREIFFLSLRNEFLFCHIVYPNGRPKTSFRIALLISGLLFYVTIFVENFKSQRNELLNVVEWKRSGEITVLANKFRMTMRKFCGQKTWKTYALEPFCGKTVSFFSNNFFSSGPILAISLVYQVYSILSSAFLLHIFISCNIFDSFETI